MSEEVESAQVRTDRGWSISVFLAFAAASAAAQSSPPPGVSQLSWALLPENCAPPVSSVAVPCGGYGDFYFGPDSGRPCAAVSGSEEPPVYAATSFAGSLPGQGSPPCLDGACFEPPGGAGGGEPWIAVLDWNNWHGWTTGWAALTVAGIPAHLYALDGPDLTPFLGTEIGDAHVLARLCQLVHAIDDQGVAPPVVLNMSFGRLLVPGEDAEDGISCDPATLSCQVGRVVDHLHGAGVAAAAAAGNHGQRLFPAAYDTVLSTGSLDLAALAETGAVAPSWEMPDGVAALAPGYGVCLDFDAGGGGSERLWPAPPGASYASAIFAGWLADHLLTHSVADPLAIDWTPRWAGIEGCYVLSELEPPHCNFGANRILARILDPSQPNCWIPSPGPSMTVTAAPIPELEVWRLLPSLVERVQSQHAALPESDPCVPCIVNRPDSPTELTLRRRDLAAQGSGNKSVPTDPVLELAASSPLPSDLSIEQLYLRVDEDFHLLLDRAFPSEAMKLDLLAEAAVDKLVLAGAGGLFLPGRQASLFYRLCAAASCYWSSFPILETD